VVIHYLLLFLILALSPVGIYLLQAILTRVLAFIGCRAVPPQLLSFGAVMLGNVPVLWLAWVSGVRPLAGTISDMASGIVYVLLTYQAIGFCYFHLLNATETSLSIHILMEMLSEGSISVEKLRRNYSPKEIIEARIDRMVSLGQMEERNGRFVLGNRTILWSGKMIDLWRMILGLPLNPE